MSGKTEHRQAATGQTFRSALILLWAAIALASSCTRNPFDHGKIRAPGRTISGKVALTDGGSPQNVYVWLEGINAGTFTDSAGNFQLTLPAGPAAGGSSGLTGVYRLYFYIANYKLETVKVALQDGEVLYGQEGLTGEGALRQPVYLTRWLRVQTIVVPESVPLNYKEKIWIKSTVQSELDSVTVVFPRSDGTFLGGVFLRNTKTDSVTIIQSAFGPEVQFSVSVGYEPRSLVRIFTLASYPLSPGTYEIIPYLLIEQPGLPRELVLSLGEHATELSPDYLKIPFRREGMLLQVTGLEKQSLQERLPGKKSNRGFQPPTHLLISREWVPAFSRAVGG